MTGPSYLCVYDGQIPLGDLLARVVQLFIHPF